jgi:nitrite reductase/ring-hydroxylating ferredoxin subunit
MFRLLPTLLLLIFVSSCRKDNSNSQVPLVAVDFTINLNDPQFIDLAVTTGWVYVTGGSMGIIIYRNNDSEFSAYDRHSPHNVNEFCQVSVNEDNITITDECSDSQWIITDGQVIDGPAQAPLRRYNTTYSYPFLRVYN